MYFDKDTKAPISLLELGLYAASGKMVVYCPEGFYRLRNVEIVYKGMGVPLMESFDDFADEVISRLQE